MTEGEYIDDQHPRLRRGRAARPESPRIRLSEAAFQQFVDGPAVRRDAIFSLLETVERLPYREILKHPFAVMLARIGLRDYFELQAPGVVLTCWGSLRRNEILITWMRPGGDGPNGDEFCLSCGARDDASTVAIVCAHGLYLRADWRKGWFQ